MDTPILVALITGAFSVVVALLGRLISTNKRDHGQVIGLLLRLERKLDRHTRDKDAHV
jgi:hypothetical protein